MCLLIFGHFFSGWDIFFSPSGYPITSSFWWQYVLIYKIHVFDEAFFFLTMRMPMVTKLCRVVICCEEL